MSCHYEISKPEVSVLMSCFNAKRWLAEAIESVLAQTFKNYEFIIINDGSTDNTWDIIQQYASIDSRIVPISKKNTGLADSLNKGILKARGRWIARLDADDLCEPTRLEEQVAFSQQNKKIVLLGTGFTEIDETGRKIKTHFYPKEHDTLVRNLETSKRFFPHSSAFYRVDIAKSIGGYNKRITRAEDKKFWLDFTLRGKIACLRTPLVLVRKHSNQVSLDQGGFRQLCDAIIATTCYYLVKHGKEDPSINLSPEEWVIFLKWVETKVSQSGILERQKIWATARSLYFSTQGKYRNILYFAKTLFYSGYSRDILIEKLLGNRLPEQLALEWLAKKQTKN